jgi:uncharacterized membrane protein YbaN (DUF454 family)
MQEGRWTVATIARAVLGSLLILVGIAGLFLPVVPGWLLIIPGLAVLARDFVWAERMHSWLKDRLDQARRRFESSLDEPEPERDAA